MTASFVAFVSVLLVVCATATTPTKNPEPTTEGDNTTEIVQVIDELFNKDDFSDVKTIEIKVKTPEPTEDTKENEERRKRSIGGLFGNRCGPIPAQRTTFVRCFVPSGVTVQRQAIVRNYYRRGDYGQCINYFRSLPLVNVAPAPTGYSGQLRTTSGRVYRVTTCQSCYRGNPGISVRCLSNPANKLVRNFIFSPQINNYNYNTYVPASVGVATGISYGSGSAGGSGGASYGSGGRIGGGGYGGGNAGFSGNVAYGGNVGYVAPVAGYVDQGFVSGLAAGNGIGYASGAGYSDGGYGVVGDLATGGGQGVQQGGGQTGSVTCLETIDC